MLRRRHATYTSHNRILMDIQSGAAWIQYLHGVSPIVARRREEPPVIEAY
jgi:hypothetical protein